MGINKKMHHAPWSPNLALFVSVPFATAFSSPDRMGRRKVSPVGVLDRCKCGHARGDILERGKEGKPLSAATKGPAEPLMDSSALNRNERHSE